MPTENPFLSSENPYAPTGGGFLSTMLSPLQWIGDTLSKPAAALRGLLADRPDQLANLIPFSDTMGITDPSQRTSGRDLLRHYGLADREDTTGNFLGGMLAEVLTDPLVLAGPLGGISKGTQLLSRAAGLGGEATTIGGAARAGASRLSNLVPQVVQSGVSSAASRTGNAVDNLLQKARMPRVFTTGAGEHGDELLSQISKTRSSIPGAGLDDTLTMLEGNIMAGQDLASMGGQVPLMQRASNAFQNAPAWTGVPAARSAGRAFLKQPAGMLPPELSVGSSIMNMAGQPSMDEREMLMRQIQAARMRGRSPLMPTPTY